MILIAFAHPSLNDLKIYSYIKQFLPPDVETTIITDFFHSTIYRNVS